MTATSPGAVVGSTDVGPLGSEPRPDDGNSVNSDAALVTTGRFNDADFALFGPYS